jgi:hypothetical protein
LPNNIKKDSQITTPGEPLWLSGRVMRKKTKNQKILCSLPARATRRKNIGHFLEPAQLDSYKSRIARWNILSTKNPKLGIFWRGLKSKMVVHVKVIWKILRPFIIWYISDHLVPILFIFWSIVARNIWQPCPKASLQIQTSRIQLPIKINWPRRWRRLLRFFFAKKISQQADRLRVARLFWYNVPKWNIK